MRTLLAFLILSASAFAGEPAKLPRPAGDALDAADKSIHSIFDTDLARAVKPSEKATLAKSLVKIADETPEADHNAERFVMYRLARELAVAGRDRATAFTAAVAIAKWWEAGAIATEPGETAGASAGESNPALGESNAAPSESNPSAGESNRAGASAGVGGASAGNCVVSGNWPGEKYFDKAQELWKDAAKAPRSDERLRLESEAAEWYAYARPTATGINLLLIEKRLTVEKEAATVVKVAKAATKTEKDADLKLLIGTWNVDVGKEWHAKWTFFADGTVNSTSGISLGKWIADAKHVKIMWNDTKWESFARPIRRNIVAGDSQEFGKGSVSATKVKARE